MRRRTRWSILPSLAIIGIVIPGIAPATAQETYRGTRQTATDRSEFVMRDLAEESAPGYLFTPRIAEEESAEGAIPHDLPVPEGAQPQTPSASDPSGPQTPSPFAPPTVAAGFQAIDDDNAVIPPDTNGAVGPSHVVSAHNNKVRIQNRSGSSLSSVTLNTFWASSGTFDPRVVYDPYNARFVQVVVNGANSASSAFKVAASATSDPTGTWYRYSYDADPGNTAWCDFPTLAFHPKWIAVTCNMFHNTTNSFVNSKIFLVDRAAVYAGAPSPGATAITNPNGGSLAPAVTYDASVSTLYVAQSWNGNSGGMGHIRLYSVTGAVGSETMTMGPLISVLAPWHWGGSLGDFAPQQGDTRKIALNDDRFVAVYRDGSVWATQTVFLPASAPTRSGVQWWELDPVANTVIQRSVIEDTSTGKFYGFPSIAVNASGDALIGYSSFSATQYAAANFAIRYSTDPANTFNADTLLKAGEASYYKTYGGPRNRWGDYSATAVDPLNDHDFWTVQEYAWTPLVNDRWATWWAHIVPNSTTPIITASPASVGFGNRKVGTFSPSQTVTVTNTGSASATLGTLSITGTNASDFQITANTCNGATLAPSSSCAADVRFGPSASGARAGALSIPHSGPGGSTQVPLAGTGTAAIVTLTPASLAFGTVKVGVTSSTLTVTVKDTGTEPLVISTVSVTGANASDFAIVSDTCTGATLPAGGGQCTIGARMTPSASGARAAQIVVAHDGPGGSTPVPMSGTGGLPGVSLNPASIAFGNTTTGTTTSPTTVTLTNTGNVALALGTITRSGAHASEFVLSSDTCSNTVRSPGATCTFRVAFAPATDGDKVAQVEVPSDAPGSPHLLPLTGRGVPAAPAVGLTPATLSFGNQAIATTSVAKNVVVTNTGNAPLVLGTLSIGGLNPSDFAITADPCSSATVAPSGTCTVSVRFTPSALGVRSASLSLPSNAGSSPDQVPLSGTGIGDGRISVNPTSLPFGNQVIGTTSAPRLLTVTNTGAGPLTITGTSITGTGAPRFTVQSNACLNLLLEMGQSCQLGVVFAPVQPGSLSATLRFTTDAPSPPTVALSGTGTDPRLTPSPASITFPPIKPGQQTAVQKVTITNTGTGTLQAIDISITGAHAAHFQKPAQTCGTTLSQGASCTVDVRHAPTATGHHSATLSLTSDDPTGAKQVALSGTSDPDPPASSFQTLNGAVLIGGFQQIFGTTTDPLAGVSSVTITARHMGVLISTFSASLSCDTTRRSCTWSFAAPLAPGTYTYNARGVDQVGNQENPGPSIAIIVV